MRGEASELALAVERRPRAPGALEEIERDRGLIAEEAEQIHLGERERLDIGPVEHLEDTEHPVVDEQRNRHQSARDIPGRLRRVAREARVLRQVVDDERLPRHEHPARNAGARREALAEQRVGAFAGDGLEDELVRLLVEQQDRRRLRVKDRASDLDGCAQQGAVRVFRAEHAGGDGCAKVGHAPPPTFVEVRCSTLFSWNGVSWRCLLRISAQMPSDMRRREAVSGRGDRLAAQPGDVDVQAAREELHGRARVRVDDERVGRLVAADRDDGRKPPGEALDGHVVR